LIFSAVAICSMLDFTSRTMSGVNFSVLLSLYPILATFLPPVWYAFIVIHSFISNKLYRNIGVSVSNYLLLTK